MSPEGDAKTRLLSGALAFLVDSQLLSGDAADQAKDLPVLVALFQGKCAAGVVRIPTSQRSSTRLDHCLCQDNHNGPQAFRKFTEIEASRMRTG